MPAKQPLTPLGVCVLGLAAERPMHPYEMYSLLMERGEDRLLKIRPGSLYHAVARLEAATLLAAQGVEREGKRPERTVYEITAAGRDALATRIRELLASPAEEYPVFLLAIAEAHNLPREEVLELLRQRRATLEGELRRYEEGLAAARDRGVEDRYLLDVVYAVAQRTFDLRWLEQLSSDLETDTLTWS